MTGEERRKKIIEFLKESDKPVSGSELAGFLSVSRQIVVSDIQLLRAGGTDIVATNTGYVVMKSDAEGVIKVRHKPEDFYDEMCTVVDLGGKVLDESINHPVYGQVTIPLDISNRSDAKRMAEAFEETSDGQLEEITGGLHFHRISANNEVVLLRIQKALNDKGYLQK